jgi:hypothetical protein
MIYGLHMRKRSKNTDYLEDRYLMSKDLHRKKLRHLYKVKLKHLKLLVLV